LVSEMQAAEKAIKARDKYIALLLEEITDYVEVAFLPNGGKWIRPCAKAREEIKIADDRLRGIVDGKK